MDKVLKYTVQWSGLCSLIPTELSVILQIRSSLRAMLAEVQRMLCLLRRLMQQALDVLAGVWQVFDALPVRPVPGFVLLSAGGGTMVQAIPKAWTNCVQCCYSPLQPHWHLFSCASYLWPFIFCNITAVVFSLILCFVNGHRNTSVFKWGIHNVSGKYQFSDKYQPTLYFLFVFYNN